MLGLVLSAAVVGSAVLSVSSATAVPKPTVKEVQAKVAKLQSQAEQASEDYNDTQVLLKSLKVRLKASQGQLGRQSVQVKAAKLKVGQLASETYRHGELSTLDLVLGDDPDSALAQAGLLPSLANRRVGAMTRLATMQQNLLTTQAQMKEQQQKALAAEKRLKSTKETVNKKLSEAQAQVNSLQASQRAQLANNQNSSESAGVPAGGGTVAACAAHSADAPSNAAKQAIIFACNQLGESYLWAADGPTRWDCSGLTMKAYAAGGVSLPHSSRLQATYGTSVSVSNLVAGDLIFFHSPISHVAIYLGGGLMVHAPHSGDVVRVASVYQTPSAAARF
jgi:cell wall-associated NlpC family hydrolase